MSSVTINQSTKNRLGQWMQSGWRENKPLFFTGVFSIGLLLLTLVGMAVDTRTLVGEPIWLKPTKFAISSVFYSLTLLWLLSYVQGYKRLIGAISWVTAGAMLVELVLISMQAWRGVRSHFNVATAFDTAVFSIMGTAILLLWMAGLVATVLLIRQKFVDPAWGTSLKLALAIGILGAGLGGLMTSPNAAQLAQMEAGQFDESGGHAVGIVDGEGGKMALVGWSTSGGDLRIGHFVGMHAMQVLPLIGLFVVRQNRRLDERKQKGLVWAAGLGYLGITLLVTWQALRGEPLIYPSALTLAAAVGLFTAVVGRSLWILKR